MGIFADIAKIADEVEKVANAAQVIKASLIEIAETLAFFKTVLIKEIGPVGFVWTQGERNPRSEGVPTMAKMSAKIVKKSTSRSAAAPLKRGDPPPTSIAIQDNEDGSLTVMGVDAAGALADASTIATLGEVSSSDPSVLTVDAPVGLTVATHGVKPGPVSVTGTVTLNDGSSGPFIVTISGNVNAGPVVAFVFVPGTVTVR